MAPRPRAQISPRKRPQQARSTDLVAAILQAAIQVLAKEGAHRFTTARVAEKAGVSVGSVYQYFPNKAAILFRLQADEWRETSQMLRGILEASERPPLDRLRELVLAFIRSECDEAVFRVALADAAPLYRDSPEAKAARAGSERIVDQFMKEALPKVSPKARATAGDVVVTTLKAVGKQYSEERHTPKEIEEFSEALSDMLCAYLVTVRKPA